MFRSNKILDLLTEICYLGIIFFVPVYFAVFLKNNSVFELNKLVIFKIFVLLILFFSVVKYILSGRKIGSIKFLYKHQMFSIFFVLGFYVLVLGLVTIFSVDIQTSLRGAYNLYNGFIPYLFYFLFFVLLFFNIRFKGQLDRIIKTIVFSSFVVCLYGAIQFMGWDVMNWSEKTSRITSTLGQPNTLAVFILMVIPFSFYLLYGSKNILLKIFYFFILILNILVLLNTYSFSGVLGLFAEIFIACVFWVYKNKNIITKKELFKFILILCFAALLIFNFYDTRPLFKKFQNSIAIGGGSSQARINFWMAGLEAIKKRPLIGYGFDTQSDVLLAYYDKDWAVYGNVNSRVARAHNLILDILLQGGVLYLTAYLALLYIFIMMIRENIQKNNFRSLNFCILFSLIGYLVFLMFQFVTVVSLVYFWLFLAIVLRINFGFDKKDNIQYNQDAKQYKIGKFILILLLFLFVFFQINKEIKRLIADHYYREIQVSHFNNDFFRSVVMYGYLKDLDIEDDYYAVKYSLILCDWIPKIAPYGLVFSEVGNELVKNILDEIKTNNYSDKFFRALSFAALADDDHLEYYDWAENLFLELESYSPMMTSNYYEHAKMKTKKRDFDGAIDNYRKALNTLPELDSPHLNKEHAGVVRYHLYLNYLGIGDAYSEMGDVEKAKEFYLLALKYNNDETLTDKIKILDE